jgi:DNA repair protein SbcD/Mre11
MQSFKFIHAADIHLDSPLRGLSRYEGLPVEEIRKATRTAFDNLIRFACDEKVDFLIIAGDLYDGNWKDMSTGLYFASAMGRLASHGIQVYLVRGNHDAASVLTRTLPPIPNVHIFSEVQAETFVLQDLDVALHGRSFTAQRVTEDMTPLYPAPVPGLFNIGLLHTSLVGYAEHETYAPCSPPVLTAKGYDYWALGHVHDHAIIATAPPIVFSGVLQGRHIRESGPKGAVLVEVVHGEVAEMRLVALDVFRWARVVIGCEDLHSIDQLHEALRQALRTTIEQHADDRAVIVRLSLVGRTTLHATLADSLSQLRDEARALAADVSPELWVEKLTLDTQPDLSPQQIQASTGALEDLLGLSSEHGEHPELLLALETELAPFLSAHPKPQAGDEDTLTAQARAGQWDRIAAVASGALRSRLLAGLQ